MKNEVSPLAYNTERKPMIISEYGRIIHDYVDILVAESDRNKRTRMAHSLIYVMENLNPSVKQQEDYKHKLWDHLYLISDFKLDVDCPYPPPSRELAQMKPENIPYPEQPIKFRFYGRNLQYMVGKAAEMKDAEDQKSFLSLLGSFMKNSSKSWNNEELTDEMIVNHIKTLSQGSINVSLEDLTIKLDPNIQSQSSMNKKKKNFTKNRSFNKKKNNYKNRM